ncbi:MAG: hypothetical protein JW971_03765 [Synergistales bacterium]|nr:hypothetical protein [Synergistales bacterium]
MTRMVAGAIVLSGFVLGMIFWIWGMFLYRKMKLQEQVFTRESENLRASPDTIRKDLFNFLINQYQVSGSARGDLLLRVNRSEIHVQVRSLWKGTGLRTVAYMMVLAGLMRKIMGFFIFFFEPLMVIGLPLTLWIFVVEDPRTCIRWQSIQVLQVIHVLWPPFLICFLNSRLRRNVLEIVDSLHHAFKLME